MREWHRSALSSDSKKNENNRKQLEELEHESKDGEGSFEMLKKQLEQIMDDREKK
jgi:hypothetical protein